jgi:hypothetical protein
MNCDDYAYNENKENTAIDMYNIQRKLLSDQEKYLKEKIQAKVNDTETYDEKLTIDEQALITEIENEDFVEYIIQIVKKTVKC